jgi:hypothetical protein
MSWDDRTVEGMELFVVEFKKDNEYMDNLVKEIALFNNEVEELVEQFMEKRALMMVK